MAGPSTGPVGVVDTPVQATELRIPMKMVQLTQFVTSTSDAWSSTYTLQGGCQSASTGVQPNPSHLHSSRFLITKLSLCVAMIVIREVVHLGNMQCTRPGTMELLGYCY